MSDLSSAASLIEALPRAATAAAVAAVATAGPAGAGPAAAAGVFAGLIAAAGGEGSPAPALPAVTPAVVRPAAAARPLQGPPEMAIDGEAGALASDTVAAELMVDAAATDVEAADADADAESIGAAAAVGAIEAEDPAADPPVTAHSGTETIDPPIADGEAPVQPALQVIEPAAPAPAGATPAAATGPNAVAGEARPGSAPSLGDASGQPAQAGGPPAAMEGATGAAPTAPDLPAPEASGEGEPGGPKILRSGAGPAAAGPAQAPAVATDAPPQSVTAGLAPATAGIPVPTPLRAGEPGRPSAMKTPATPAPAANAVDGAAGAPGAGPRRGANAAARPAPSAAADAGNTRPWAALINPEFGERPGHRASSTPSTPENPVFASSAGAEPPTVRATLHTLPGTPPGLPVRAIAIHIAQRFDAGDRRFEIRLDPPELGRIDVRLEIGREGHVTAHLTADRPDTLDALQRDARGLERALQTAGLDTGEDGLTFQLREHGAGQRGPTGGRADREAGEDGDAESGTGEAIERRLVSLTAVDLRI